MADPRELLRQLDAIEADKRPDPRRMLQELDAYEKSQENVIATNGDGQFIRMDDGSTVFKSPGYSTNDPETVQRLIQGDSVKRVVQSGFDQQTIAQNPVAARVNEFNRGTPFIGSYLDEAVGVVSPQARDAMRQTSDAMQREKPGQTMGLNIAGGVGYSAPLAIAAAPGISAAAPTSTAARTAAGIGAGTVAGGTEGAVYGAGEGTNAAERAQEATSQGIIGAGVGAGFGALGPLAANGIEALAKRWRGEDVARISSEFGISKDAAKVLKQAFQSNDQDAVSRILRAGPEATLADAGRSGQALLDASAATGGRALQVVDDAVGARSQRSAQRLTGALDETFGTPQGPRATARRVARETRPQREAAYGAAYDTPIDYAAPEGRRIEAVLGRIDGDTLSAAIREANAEMKADEVVNRQIMAQIADDGTVTFREMPNVQQLDYLKRALDGGVEKDTFGRPTQRGQRQSRLSKALRKAIVDATGGDEGAYAQALKVGQGKIEMDQGLELGLNMLRDTNRTTREIVSEELAGMSDQGKAMVRAGLRSHIDETLGAVKMIASDPEAMESRQAMQALRMLTSDNAKSKLRVLLGPEEYKQLMPKLDEAVSSQSMRAAVATNSKTAVRQSVQGAAKDATAPGMVGRLARGEPINAAQSLTQELLNTTPAADAARAEQLWTEIAQVLTDKRGGRAIQALKFIEQAMAGQPITERKAKLIANEAVAAGLLSADRTANQLLAQQ